jgi:hypothetical protein
VTSTSIQRFSPLSLASKSYRGTATTIEYSIGRVGINSARPVLSLGVNTNGGAEPEDSGGRLASAASALLVIATILREDGNTGVQTHVRLRAGRERFCRDFDASVIAPRLLSFLAGSPPRPRGAATVAVTSLQ